MYIIYVHVIYCWVKKAIHFCDGMFICAQPWFHVKYTLLLVLYIVDRDTEIPFGLMSVTRRTKQLAWHLCQLYTHKKYP